MIIIKMITMTTTIIMWIIISCACERVANFKNLISSLKCETLYFLCHVMFAHTLDLKWKCMLKWTGGNIKILQQNLSSNK